MTNLITEARELCAIDIEKQPIHAEVIIEELCDALEKAQEQNKRLVRELSKLACESAERDRALARLEAEVMAAIEPKRGEWIENPTKDSVLCSYCHADWNLFDNDTYRFCYCPNCGAKMEVEP